MSMYPSNYNRPSSGQYGGPNSFGMGEQVPSGNPFGRRQPGDSPFNPFNRPQQQDYYAPQNQFNRYQQNNNRSANRFIEQQSYSNPYQQQQPYFNRSQRQRPYFTPYQQQPQQQEQQQQQLDQQQFQPQQQPPRRPPLQDTLNSLMSHADKVTHGVNMLRQMSNFLSSFR